jgi:NAD(P)-dependent dehydrogenase (short-subunit alcohol dehydrogenase family)
VPPVRSTITGHMRTVLITGTNRGIGRALAEKFLSEGWRVIGTYYNGEEPIQHERFTLIKMDLRSPESIEACAKELAGGGHEFEVVINNAGVLLDEAETRLKVAPLRETLEVNLIGTGDFTERVAPMIARGGHLVFISSTAGSLERAGSGLSHFPFHYPAYKISKAALNIYGRTLAHELEDQEVTVSMVHPGWVRTRMGGQEADLSPQEAAEDIYAHAMRRPESGQFWFRGEKLPW